MRQFGIPADAYLSALALEAVMKMHCDASGAGYAVYWKEEEVSSVEEKTDSDGGVRREKVRTRKLTVGGAYLEAAQEASALRGGGRLADSVSGVILDINGESLVAMVARSRVPYFLQDAKQRPKATRGFVLEFGIASMCLVPVLGGVLEYGTFAAEQDENGLAKGATGLKWSRVGNVKPEQGREISNSLLASALSVKTEFSPEELGSFFNGSEEDLRVDDVIKAEDGSYYQPAAGVEWGSIEDAKPAVLPLEELQKAFSAGATHAIFWKQTLQVKEREDGDVDVSKRFEWGADYISAESVKALKNSRRDDKSFTSESRGMVFDEASQDAVVAASLTGQEIIIANPASWNNDGGEDYSFARRELAQEFNMGNIHFVPCKGGVLEYGTGSAGQSAGHGSGAFADKEALREAFNKFDTKGGRLEDLEVVLALREVGIETSVEKVKDLIDSVDVDGDGVLDYQEFESLVENRM